MCAGTTVFVPIKEHNVKGKRVGVVGLGGLGHLAVQFLAKFGAEVTVLSHSDDKRDDAIKLGATKFINTATSSPEKSSLDMLFVFSFKFDADSLLELLDFGGKFILICNFVTNLN